MEVCIIFSTAAERRMIMKRFIELKLKDAELPMGVVLKKRTNADRIRSMTDEELAMCLFEIGYDGGWGAPEGTLEWLQQPAKVTK